MMEILNYLRTRYMSEKAQGMVEYALIIAFVVVLAVALTQSDGLQSAIKNVFGSATDAVKKGNTSSGS